jgi:uncharacterized protein YjiS (DUF1127 family)
MYKLGKKLARWYKTRARQQRTVRELSLLNNRELADIGLSRGDIERVAKDINYTRSWSAL